MNADSVFRSDLYLIPTPPRGKTKQNKMEDITENHGDFKVSPTVSGRVMTAVYSVERANEQTRGHTRAPWLGGLARRLLAHLGE